MTGRGSFLSQTADDVREFFFLREAEGRAESLNASTRTELSQSAQKSRQKREAAEALWAHGSPAEALVLARDAAMLMFESAERAAVQLSPEQRSLRDSAKERAFPALDHDVTHDDAELYRQLIAAHRALDVAVAPTALDAAGRRRTRATRLATVSTIALGLVGALLYFVLRPAPVGVEASAIWSMKYAAANAVDGVDSTEWLLPDSSAGWIDFKFAAPRNVQRMTLRNAVNEGGPNRGTNEFELEIWAGNQLLRKITGSLAPWSATTPTVREIPLEIGAAKITRVRVNVRSWFGAGGGLAEASFR